MKVKNIEKQGKKLGGKSAAAKWFRLALIVTVVVAGIGVLLFLRARLGNPDSSIKELNTFTARRGDMTISVTEHGDVKALKCIDIKSEVEGRTTIISIVEEGIYITQEDVNNGKILAELDSSSIKERLTQQKITFSNAQANYAEAKEANDIQVKQNDSDIQKGQLEVRFALMDFKKYLGETAAEKFINDANQSLSLDIDVTSLLDEPKLGGLASQELKELKDNIILAEENHKQAVNTLEWTLKLEKKKYVSTTELERDKLKVQSLEIQKEKTEIALELFKLYEFPKETVKLLRDYREAGRELERVEARARSKLAQAQAHLRNREATYALEKERLEKFRKQFSACTLRAPVPGQVVYSSSMMDRRLRQRRLIDMGLEVRVQRYIITIPDFSE